MTSHEAAWLAGIVEGEGCISIDQYGPAQRMWATRGRVTVRVHMTDRDVIERIAQVVGHGKVHEREPNTLGRKPIYTWFVVGARAADVLRAVLPWLGERRTEKAWLALDYLRDTTELRALRGPLQGVRPYES